MYVEGERYVARVQRFDAADVKVAMLAEVG